MSDFTDTSNVAELPKRKADEKCNAKLARGGGYCVNFAGEGTTHPGAGRCRLHGGTTQELDFEDVLRAAGWGYLVDMAEGMSEEHQEYAMEMTTKMLVLRRMDVVSKMMQPGITPKEYSDLSMTLQRLDAAIDRRPMERKEAGASEEESDEAGRLLSIEAKLGRQSGS